MGYKQSANLMCEMSQQENQRREKKKNYFLSSSLMRCSIPSETMRDCGTPDSFDVFFSWSINF